MFRQHKIFYLIVAIIFALAASAYVLVKIYNFKTEEEIGASSIPLQQGALREKNLADWKTYRNQKYAYELQYPPAWLVNNTYSDADFETRGSGDVMGGDTYWQNYKWSSDPQTGPSDPPNGHRSLYLIVYNDQKNKTIDKHFGLDNYPNGYAKLLQVNDFRTQYGTAGRQYVTESLDHPLGAQIITTIFQKDNNFFVFNSPIVSKEIHSQILSTFKFIPSTPLGASEP